MAKFEIVEKEVVRMVKVTLQHETVRTESEALYYMRGAITMESNVPSVGGLLGNHLKSGQWESLQNRPTDDVRGQGYVLLRCRIKQAAFSFPDFIDSL